MDLRFVRIKFYLIKLNTQLLLMFCIQTWNIVGSRRRVLSVWRSPAPLVVCWSRRGATLFLVPMLLPVTPALKQQPPTQLDFQFSTSSLHWVWWSSGNNINMSGVQKVNQRKGTLCRNTVHARNWQNTLYKLVNGSDWHYTRSHCGHLFRHCPY